MDKAHRTRTKHDAQSLVGKGEWLRLTLLDRPVRPRRLGVITSFGTLDDVRTHDRDVWTLHRGVTERVFGIEVAGKLAQVPRSTVDFRKLIRPLRRQILRRMPHLTRQTRQSFVDTYVGRRRAIYQRAADSLELWPLERRDADQSVFVKADKDNHSRKHDPAPRIISCRDPRYTVEVGRYLKTSEHHFFEAMSRAMHYPVVLKGLSPTGVARWLKSHLELSSDMVAVLLDASRFDQSIDVPKLQFEHKFYNSVFKDPLLAEYLTWQLRSTAKGRCSDGQVSFRRNGGRGSGDINTGLGNCLIMASLVITFAREQGLEQFRVSNNGDDCVLFMKRSQLALVESRITAWFLAAGIRMKVEGVTSVLEEVEFCQSRPVCVEGTYRMIRCPRKALSGDVVSTKALTVELAKQHLGAVGVCGGVLSRGVPIYQQFYASLRNNGSGDPRRILRSDEYKHYGFTGMAYRTDPLLRTEMSAITPETRVSFWLAFGITPPEQVDLESHFLRALPLGRVVDSYYEKDNAHNRLPHHLTLAPT